MNSRRVLILIVAIVVGAVAAFGVTSYVRSVEDSNAAGTEIQQVWVVQREIEKATTFELALQEGMIALEDMPTEFRPSTAITNPEVELAGLVAVTNLPMNSVLVAGNFVPSSVVATGITDRLEERGMVSVTLSIGQTSGAGYMIEPGDYVNVMTDTPFEDGGDDEELADGAVPTEAAPADGVDVAGRDRSDVDIFMTDVRYVYQQVEVLAVGSTLTADLGETEDEEAAPVSSGLITLAVPPEAAQVLIGIGLDNLYLSLVPSNYVPRVIPPLNADQRVMPGENTEEGAVLTPYVSETSEPVE